MSTEKINSDTTQTPYLAFYAGGRTDNMQTA